MADHQGWRDRVAARGEPSDGWYHMIHDETWSEHGFPTPLYGLTDLEETADIRVIRVHIQQPLDWITPPCPSTSQRVRTNEREVNIRIECSEEKTLFELLYEVHDGVRLLDTLEAKLDLWIKRPSRLARLVDIYFSRFSRSNQR